MKCPNCYAEASGKFCEYCGSEMPREKSVTNVNNSSKTIINNYYTGSASSLRQTQEINRRFIHRPPFHSQPPGPSAEMSRKKFDSVRTTILLLVFFYPLGLIVMWTRKHFSKNTRIVITLFFVLLTIVSLASRSINSAGTAEPIPDSDTTLESIVPDTETDTETNTNTKSQEMIKGFVYGFGSFIQFEESEP